jgi:hypothetical protein
MRVEFKMKYIQHWTDDLGRRRFRFRRKGYPRVELPVNSDPSSPEFQAAYHAALRGEKPEHELAMVAARDGSGSAKTPSSGISTRQRFMITAGARRTCGVRSSGAF